MELTYHSKQQVAPNVWEFSLTSARDYQFIPGQYAHFWLPDRTLGYRTFTITSHPTEQTVRFMTRFDQPLSPYKAALLALPTGAQLTVGEAMGDAVLPRLSSTPLVFVAQGLALASYLSILAECESSALSHLDVRERSFHTTLLWVRRSEDDPLEKLIPRGVRNLTRVDLHYPDRLAAAGIAPHLQPNSLVYLSGSQTFVETLGTELETTGTPRARLIYDYYDGYANL